jgi:hypothetical protein
MRGIDPRFHASWWPSAAGAHSGRRRDAVGVIGVLVDGVGVGVQRQQAPSWGGSHRGCPWRWWHSSSPGQREQPVSQLLAGQMGRVVGQGDDLP